MNSALAAIVLTGLQHEALSPAPVTGVLNRLSERYELKWVAGQRGKPGINGDMASGTEAVREIADPDFEILGTNSTSALCTYWAEGGITLTTAGADNDQMIVAPHLDGNQSPWTQVTWGTDQQVEWECSVTTDASIALMTFYVGLKLTNTSVSATDATQIFLRYAAATNSGKFQAVVGGGTATDTGLAVAASTTYRVKIGIDAARIARIWIDNDLVFTSTSALTDATDLIPYIGLHANTAAAKVLHVSGQAIARDIGA